jgi:hypothetical protein
MKKGPARPILLLMLAASMSLAGPGTSSAQPAAPELALQSRRSPGKAFALSLLLPGLGHRYANGRWTGGGTTFALVDVGLWVGLITGEWSRNRSVQSYTTLAASGADADVEGKDRSFFLNLATYESSDEYLEVQLRTRNWDRLEYVSDPSFQWAWSSMDDFERYRELRDDAESLSRRRSIIIAALVANRLLSGLISARKAHVLGRDLEYDVGVAAPVSDDTAPQLQVSVRF